MTAEVDRVGMMLVAPPGFVLAEHDRCRWWGRRRGGGLGAADGHGPSGRLDLATELVGADADVVGLLELDAHRSLQTPVALRGGAHRDIGELLLQRAHVAAEALEVVGGDHEAVDVRDDDAVEADLLVVARVPLEGLRELDGLQTGPEGAGEEPLDRSFEALLEIPQDAHVRRAHSLAYVLASTVPLSLVGGAGPVGMPHCPSGRRPGGCPPHPLLHSALAAPVVLLRRRPRHGRVAELADALDSGSSGLRPLGVQVPPRPLNRGRSSSIATTTPGRVRTPRLSTAPLLNLHS
jgi:hypothetical protein